tara:strand:- start:1635 stop:2657 length:1023 start_codon:yes stop_codon:yes gene_type:complete
MNFVYHGEPFIVEQKINELKSEIDNGDANSTNINIFDANEVNPDNILNACYSMPFLSSKRLVIIKGLLSIFESKKSSRGRFNQTKQTSKSMKVSEWDSLAEEIPKFPDTTLLIFLDPQLSDNNKILNKIKPHVKINHFPQPNGNELIKWIKEKASSKNCQIEEKAIVELLRYTESDLRKIDSELEKLALYNPTDTITIKDVETLVIPISNPNLFTSIDAILAGNKKYALNSLIDLMNQGTPAQLIIALLGKQIRTLILIKSLINLGLPNRELIKRIPINSYALQKLTRIQNKISLISLQNMHKVLIDADYKTKTTNTQADLIIELVIIELSRYALSEAKP